MAGGTECSSKPEGRLFERCFSLVISNNLSAGPKQGLTARKLRCAACIHERLSSSCAYLCK